MLKLIKVVFYSNYSCTFVLRKEAIKQPIKKPYKDEKFKTSSFLCCCSSIGYYYAFINASTIQII